MKKDKFLNDFMEGIEMIILPQEDQILLSSIGGFDFSGITNKDCSLNNCEGGNCIKGCGENK